MIKNNTPLICTALICAACVPPAVSENSSHNQNENNDEVTTLAPVDVAGSKDSLYRKASTNTVTFTNTPVEELPIVVDIINDKMIEEVSADSLNDVLKYEAGITNGGDTPYQRDPGTYGIRGRSGSEVTLNGLPIPGSLGASLDTSLLQSVEVIKGPAGGINGGRTSTLGAYGAGGSIAIIMKQAEVEKDFTILDASARMGAGHKYRFTFDTNQVLESGKMALRVVGATWYDRPFWLKDGAKGGTGVSISPLFTWKPNEKTTLNWETTYQYSDQPVNQGIPVLQGKIYGAYNAWYGAPGSNYINQGFLTMLRGEVKTNATWSFRGGAGMGYTKNQMSIWGLGSSPSNYTGIIKDGTSSVEYSGQHGYHATYTSYAQAFADYNMGQVNNQSLMGLDFNARISGQTNNSFGKTSPLPTINIYHPEYINPFDYQSSMVYTSTKQELYKFGAILQNQATYEDWGWLLGVREDLHFSDQGNTSFAFSPRTGLTRKLGKEVILFGNISQTESPNFNYLDENDQELTETWKCLAYETGFRYNPVKDLWFSASYFWTTQDNTPVAVDNLHYASTGKNRTEGVELSLKGAVTSWWDTSVSYAYTQYTDCAKGIQFDRYPSNTVVLWQTFKIPTFVDKPLRASVGYRFAQKYNATFRGDKISIAGQGEYTVPSYDVFDLTFEQELPEMQWLPKTSVRFGIYNIFNERYITAMRHAAQCFAGEPRTFELGLKMTF